MKVVRRTIVATSKEAAFIQDGTLLPRSWAWTREPASASSRRGLEGTFTGCRGADPLLATMQLLHRPRSWRQRLEAGGVGAMSNREIGIGLTGFGVLFTFLGIVFFFDKALLAVGNILFVAGVTLTIGMKGTISFFLKPRNYKGSILSGVGFCLVVYGWAFIGMMIEAYGCFLLFSGFWPTVLVFLSRLPILGPILQQPFIVEFFDRFRERRIPV